MPKVSTENSSAPTRAPRKRAVRRVVAKSDTPVRRTRSVSSASRETSEAAAPRKAPARVVSVQPKSRMKLYVIAGTIVVIAGAATWIGVSDAGQIDVNARINEMNERAASAPREESENNEPQSVVVPVQNTPPVVEASNLSGRGVGTPNVVQPTPEAVPEVATTTEATTTDEAALPPEEAPVEGEVTEAPVE